MEGKGSRWGKVCFIGFGGMDAAVVGEVKMLVYIAVKFREHSRKFDHQLETVYVAYT